MAHSEIPPPPELDPGNDLPVIRVRPPGPESRSWLLRSARAAAPMGPRITADRARGIRAEVPSGAIVYESGKGSNVLDVDGNRYVDLAAGFGALLLGHGHPRVLRAVEHQAPRLMQALGDVYPSDARIALLGRLAELYPRPGAQVILGQSGADAVSAALKTAALATGRPGVLACSGAYHGLSYGPLAALGLRPSYREPFSAQLNPHASFVDYPASEAAMDEALERARFALARGDVGAVLVEPILGRGGCLVPPAEFLPELGRLARAAGAVMIADEVWTGLGRAGKSLFSTQGDFVPELVCLGKGLGGGLPMSACVGSSEVMRAWSRDAEVVHTSTFAGAPLACTTALATLDVLSRERLPERAARVGDWFKRELEAKELPGVREIRGAGLMLALDLGARPGAAVALMRALLERGFIVSTGGGQREALILTPPLVIAESLLSAFVTELRSVLDASPR
ncbi:MAG: aspartate aminotransferase family protein [Sorangiineae bacterium]|nr:aspartate aminotransferase family protein [Polyangiaceae bacterium]MEB2323159.1 aspartate aminotransferase family protein [Sorangiineae bacterium]